jgi:hypothetical protein
MRAVSSLFKIKRVTEAGGKTDRLRLGLLCAAVTLAVAASGAPLPPPRPAEFGKPAADDPSPATPPTSMAATQTAPPPSGRAPVDVDINALQPFNLPPASRQKMRQCGEEWRALKMAGKSNGLVWRTFAGKCLAR